ATFDIDILYVMQVIIPLGTFHEGGTLFQRQPVQLPDFVMVAWLIAADGEHDRFLSSEGYATVEGSKVVSPSASAEARRRWSELRKVRAGEPVCVSSPFAKIFDKFFKPGAA